MGQPVLQHQPHQFLRRRRHIPEALPERNHGEPVVLQILHHLRGIPAVVGDLPDVVLFAQLADEFFNEPVMYHVALGGLKKSLLFPYVVHDVVAPNAQRQRLLRQPEEGQNLIGF